MPPTVSYAAGVMSSPAIDACRHFLTVVWDGPPPDDERLLEALDRFLAAYHTTPDDGPSDDDPDPPAVDDPALYRAAASRFPDYGLYPTSDPVASFEEAAMTGDAVDDIADITRDLRDVLWYFDHQGLADAHWSFRLHYMHWGRHARELSLYLHARQYG